MNVVTGAFSYSGRYVARLLLDAGEEVTTLTGHPDRPDPFGGRVRAHPFHFDDPAALARTLEGASTLYNTYWVRFPYRGTTFESAVRNTRTLFRAAKEAGVGRVVHVSITNPSPDSPLPYFRGKAAVEEDLRASDLSHAIVRPTVLFGGEDVLINNIAYFVRRLPLFFVPGSGEYRLQPVHVEDHARIVVEAGRGREDLTTDAAGPETFAYRDLVRLIARTLGSRARILQVPPTLALLGAKALGPLLGDVVLTRDEVEGLMAELLVSHEPPRGETKLSEWVIRNRSALGRWYASELDRHYR